MEIVQSRNGVPVRLTEERRFHITEEHSEIAGHYFEVLETLQEPDAVYEGGAEKLPATKEIEAGKHLVVVYKELGKEDGFVITAFLTRRIEQIQRRTRI